MTVKTPKSIEIRRTIEVIDQIRESLIMLSITYDYYSNSCLKVSILIPEFK